MPGLFAGKPSEEPAAASSDVWSRNMADDKGGCGNLNSWDEWIFRAMAA